MSKVSLSLVIPNYDEEEAIPTVMQEISEVKSELRNSPLLSDIEVIVVDDGSSDNSLNLLKQYPWIKIYTHTENKGYGAAIKTGVKNATGEYIALLDMDATYHVKDLLHFSEQIIEKETLMVVGDRQLCKKSMPPIRRFGNWLLTSFASLVSSHKIKDCCSGIRVVKADFLKEVAPKLPDTLDFALALTLTMVRTGRPFLELPTVFKKRLGDSKLSEPLDGIRFLFCILNNRPFLRFAKD